MTKELSVVYVNYQVDDLLLKSIESIFKHPPRSKFEIVVVDNSNSKNLEKRLEKYKNVKSFHSYENIGFGRACNLGVSKASGKYLLFLNPDTKVTKNSIDLMLEKIKSDKKIGVLGPKITNSKGITLPSISNKLSKKVNIFVYSFINSLWKKNPISKGFWLYNTDRTKEQEVDVVSGACMMISKQLFEKAKGFDKQFFMYFEEYDLCLRIQKMGLKIVYYPKSSIIHLIGQSLTDKSKIKKYFEKSRYLYSKKHFGLIYAILSELFLRFVNFNSLIIGLIVMLSSLVNIYRQDQLMLFIGDIARDFVVSKEVYLGGPFPIVGIPSSVTWLHQGPISQWLVLVALYATNFNTVAPAVLFGFIGGVTSSLIYILGSKYFNRTIGIVSALIYLCAPIITVNARMPYHTSLVPFFTAIFFIVLPDIITNKKRLVVLSFLFGLLLMVELSNVVVLGIVIVLLFHHKIKVSMKVALKSVVAFCIGVLPFLIHDFINGPTYLKFPIWIIYRIYNSSLGETSSSEGLVNNFYSTAYQQFSGSVLPQAPLLSIFLILTGLIFLARKAYLEGKIFHEIILLWVTVPFFAFLLHGSPGTAYFSLLYPAIALVVGVLLVGVFKNKLSITIAVIILILNVRLLLINDFFVNTNLKSNIMPPTMYSFGNTYLLSLEVSKAIVKDAREDKITLKPYGIMTLYKTSLDPYRFLIWKLGGELVEDGEVYIISESRRDVPDSKIIFQNRTDQVLRYE